MAHPPSDNLRMLALLKAAERGLPDLEEQARVEREDYDLLEAQLAAAEAEEPEDTERDEDGDGMAPLIRLFSKTLVRFSTYSPNHA